MAEYVGVDWGSNGWICAIYDGKEWSARFHPSFLSVWHHHRSADSILVDIPIGLLQTGLRECDQRAVEALGGPHQSVFYTPPRPVFAKETYPAAKETYRELTGRGMTTQAWSFMPRIRELDEFFAEFPEAHGTKGDSPTGVREAHPEICFSMLSNRDISVSKLQSEGQSERLEVLSGLPGKADEEFRRLKRKYIDEFAPHERRFRESQSDDLLDAVGLATTALLANRDLQTLPDHPPTDGRGLPMEIVYTDPTN